MQVKEVVPKTVSGKGSIIPRTFFKELKKTGTKKVKKRGKRRTEMSMTNYFFFLEKMDRPGKLNNKKIT